MLKLYIFLLLFSKISRLTLIMKRTSMWSLMKRSW